MRIATYKNYLQYLEDYATRNGITVVYRPFLKDCDAFFSKKEIHIKTENVKRTIIANFLHELGHMRDDFFPHNKKLEKQIELAYVNYNANKKMTNFQKKILLETEYRAWQNGIAIAKQIKIKLGKWFNNEIDYAIYSYYKILFPKNYEQKFKEDFINGELRIKW